MGKPSSTTLLLLCLATIVYSTELSATSNSNDPFYKLNSQLSPRMKSAILAHTKIVSRWLEKPLLINATIAQNNQKLSLDKIKKIDEEWINGNNSQFIQSLINSEAGQFLKTKVQGNPIYTEAFLCDNQGAIVALFPKTTDYWQGDEDKFTASFNKGEGELYIGGLSFDESTQSYSVQLSIPVFDNNTTVGVLIVGLRNIRSNKRIEN